MNYCYLKASPLLISTYTFWRWPVLSQVTHYFLVWCPAVDLRIQHHLVMIVWVDFAASAAASEPTSVELGFAIDAWQM